MSNKKALDLLNNRPVDVLKQWGMEEESANKFAKDVKTAYEMFEDAVKEPKVMELLKKALVVRCRFGTNKEENVLQFEMQFALNPDGFSLLNFIYGGNKSNDKKDTVAHA